MPTKDELKTRLVTGHKVTQQDMHDIIDIAGEKGDKGDPGNNGFGTQVEYDAIIARLDALETP